MFWTSQVDFDWNKFKGFSIKGMIRVTYTIHLVKKNPHTSMISIFIKLNCLCHPHHSYFFDFTSKKYTLVLSFRQNNIRRFFCNPTLVLQRLPFCNYILNKITTRTLECLSQIFLFTFVREKPTFSTRSVLISWKKLVPTERKSSFFIVGIKVCMKSSFKLIKKKAPRL